MSVPTPERLPESPVVPGRAAPLPEFALQRLRANRLLQACLVVAFMGYGGLAFLLVAGRIKAAGPVPFFLVSLVTFLSLASWGFLFLWYPALERMQRQHATDPERRWIGIVLEVFAVGCVAFVHLLMAIMLVHLARA